jgi:hypothetical protein
MRRELAAAVEGLFAGIDFAAEPPAITEAERERFVSLANLAALCRSGVARDGQKREIELVMDPEGPARLAGALLRLYRGMLVIGLDRETAWRVARRAALDSMPKTRRAVFDQIVRTGDAWRTTTSLAAAIGLPSNTTRRALEDLTAHAVAARRAGGGNKGDEWALTDQARALLAACVPEMSGDVHARRAAGHSSTTPNTVADDFSGTQARGGGWSEFDGPDDASEGNGQGEGERQAHCWQCKASLAGGREDACDACGWLVCDCGACADGCERGAAPEADACPKCGGTLDDGRCWICGDARCRDCGAWTGYATNPVCRPCALKEPMSA